MKTNINGHKAATEESIAPHLYSINNQWNMPGEWIKQKRTVLQTAQTAFATSYILQWRKTACHIR